MLIDHTDRVVIVSGAGRGIGREIALRFAAEGAQVVALDLAFEDVSESESGAAPEAKRPLTRVVCDVTDEESVRSAVAGVEADFGRVDVLVNNAGINVVGTVEELTAAQWRRCMDVNTTGVLLLSQAVIPAMRRQRWGRILNAASFAAIVPSVGSAAYAASKAAVVAFTRVLAGELGPWDVTVNAYAPGMVPTAMNGFADMPPERQSALLDTLTLRRWERAEDVADLLVFLASDAAGYITGTLVDVSGGKLATQIPSRAYEGFGDEVAR